MRPFTIDIPQSALDDLRRRIAATRWPASPPTPGWERGVPTDYLRDMAEYWRGVYDWRAAEAELNRHPQFITTIDGLDVHFLHIRSPHADAMPLILTHGWPSSFVEFLDVIGPLTNPVAHGGRAADAFHVVIPSLPGYAFSGVPAETGWDTRRTGAAWARLMAELGYTRYVVQGGDWGMPVSLRTALADPQHVVGIHLSMFVSVPPEDPRQWPELSENEFERLAFAQHFEQDGAGWRRLQSSRPQTLAYALTDSPVGQLAWIVEKFKEWTDSDKVPEDAIDRDRILTNASLYWFTASAGPSAQFYFESNHMDETFFRTWVGPWHVSAPVAVAAFPADAVRPVRAFAEPLLPTLARWTEFDRGGHFAALEQPESFVGDVRDFVRPLR